MQDWEHERFFTETSFNDNFKRLRNDLSDNEDEFDDYSDALVFANESAKRICVDDFCEQPTLSDFLYARDAPAMFFQPFGEPENACSVQQLMSDNSAVEVQDEDSSNQSGADHSDEFESQSDEGQEEESSDQSDACNEDEQQQLPEQDASGAAEVGPQELEIDYSHSFESFFHEDSIADEFVDHVSCASSNTASTACPQDGPALTVDEYSVFTGAILDWAKKWAQKLGTSLDVMMDRVLRILSTPACFPIKFCDLPDTFASVFRKFVSRISTSIAPFHEKSGILHPNEVFVTFTATQKDHYVCSTIDWLRLVARSAFQSEVLPCEVAVGPVPPMMFVLPHAMTMQGFDAGANPRSVIRGVSKVHRFTGGCSFAIHSSEKAACEIESIIEACMVPIRIKTKSEGNLVHLFREDGADFDIEFAKLQLACFIYRKANFVTDRRLKRCLAYSEIQMSDVNPNKSSMSKLPVFTDMVRVTRQICDWCDLPNHDDIDRKELFAIAHLFLFSPNSMYSAWGVWDTRKINAFASRMFKVQTYSEWQQVIIEYTGKSKGLNKTVGTHLNCSGKLSPCIAPKLASFEYLLGANKRLCDRCANGVCPYKTANYGRVQSLQNIEFETDVRFLDFFAYFLTK